MTTVLILYDVKGWAYYWRALALQKYAPEDFKVLIDNSYGLILKKQKVDIVVQLAYSYAKQVRIHLTKGNYKDTALVSSYNVGWNYNNRYMDETVKHSDYVIVNNKEMWERYGRRPNTFHISNGVDRTVFFPTVPYDQRKDRILWIGSKGHSKTKNFDNILIPLRYELNKKKILCDFRCVNSCGSERMNQDQMRDWYNTGSMYVVASKTEGTPNPAIEAASCGLPVVSTRVGNMPELIKDGHNGHLCEMTVKSLLDGVLKTISNKQIMSNNMIEEIQSWDWKERSKQYYELFRKMVQK
jgi:glycosyltransferase involved in cell wall biosynthesis